MRAARITGEGMSYYHGISRVIERAFVLSDDEKERFRILLRKTASFSGVTVLTHSVMDNHTHLVLEVPEGEPVAEEETYRRMRAFYEDAFVTGYAERVRHARKHGHEDEAERLLDAYRHRMHNISEFMKTLLQRFTQNYNRRHDRHGTLWEGRFKSVLVEGDGTALAMLCAYVDLNAVRAGIVEDPKDYRFCGYGEAVAGNYDARVGQLKIQQLLGQTTEAWDGDAYRQFIYTQGTTHQKGATRTETFLQHAQDVLDHGGKLTLPELLHCRVRYFSDGLVLGSRIFVQDVFNAHREEFGPKRQNGPRPIRQAELPTLFTLRDLRKAPILPPG